MTPDSGEWKSFPKIGEDSSECDVLQHLHWFPFCWMVRLGFRQILEAFQQLSASRYTAESIISDPYTGATDRELLTRMLFVQPNPQ